MSLAKRVGSSGNLFFAFSQSRGLLFAFAATALLAGFSIHRLNGTPYEISFGATMHGLSPILSSTLVPAIELSLIWAIGTAALAAAILRINPEIGLLDALLGGAAGVWMTAYLLGQILGPFGLFQCGGTSPAFVARVIWLLWRRPKVPRLKVSGGLKLALISFCSRLTCCLPNLARR